MGHLLRLKVVWNLSFPQPYICIPACQDGETKGKRMGSLELEWVLNTVRSKALQGRGQSISKCSHCLFFFFFDSGFWILTNVTSQFLEISGSRNYGIGKVLCIIFRINFTWKACGGGSCFSFECRLCFILKAWVTRSGCVVSAGFEAVGLGRVIQST